MGRKGISYEKKLEAVERYKRGEGSQDSIAREYGVKKSSVRRWIANYEAMGTSGLAPQGTNSKYSVELKNAAIEAYLQGEGSQMEICKRYCIRSEKQLRSWITMYNDHKELRSTEAEGEVST